MKYNNMEYDGCVVKPELDENLLEHFGVKGMKWRIRKAIGKYKIKAQTKLGQKMANLYLDKSKKKAINKANASHLADDVVKGRKKESKSSYAGETDTYNNDINKVIRYKPSGKKTVAVITRTRSGDNDSFGTSKSSTEKEYDKALKSAKKRKK